MFGRKLEIGGRQLWPDDPDEELLKMLVESPRFRVGLLVWYIQDERLWLELCSELGGSFPVEWMVTSKPPEKTFMEVRLGVLKKASPHGYSLEEIGK